MAVRERGGGGRKRESMCLAEITSQTWTNVVQHTDRFPFQEKKERKVCGGEKEKLIQRQWVICSRLLSCM